MMKGSLLSPCAAGLDTALILSTDVYRWTVLQSYTTLFFTYGFAVQFTLCSLTALPEQI